jgi:hypothetical protein
MRWPRASRFVVERQVPKLKHRLGSRKLETEIPCKIIESYLREDSTVEKPDLEDFDLFVRLVGEPAVPREKVDEVKRELIRIKTELTQMKLAPGDCWLCADYICQTGSRALGPGLPGIYKAGVAQRFCGDWKVTCPGTLALGDGSTWAVMTNCKRDGC